MTPREEPILLVRASVDDKAHEATINSAVVQECIALGSGAIGDDGLAGIANTLEELEQFGADLGYSQSERLIGGDRVQACASF